MKRVLLWMMILLICQSVFANVNRNYVNAAQFFEVGNYTQALVVLNSIEKADQDSPDYALLMGKVLLAKGEYKSAHAWLTKYSISYLGMDTIASPVLLQKIYEAGLLQEASPVALSLGRISGSINSHDSEYAPVLADNGKAMILGSDRRSVYGGENIYISNYINKKWTDPVEIKELCTDRNETVGSVSSDGKMLYLSGLYDPKENNASIYKSNLVNGAWAKPEMISMVSSRFHDFQPYVHNDKVMFFVSNRHGNNKNYDIYVSENINGVWRAPINLGEVINTKYDEQTPFLSADGKTLYFASNGHAGYGGYDIFRATRTGDTWIEWSEPENMGPIINSLKDDRHYMIDPDGINAYLSSNRFDGLGLEDLMYIDLRILAQLQKLLEAKLAELGKTPEEDPVGTPITNEIHVSGIVVDQDNRPMMVDIVWNYVMDGVTYMQIVDSGREGAFSFALPRQVTNLCYEVRTPGYRRVFDKIDITDDKSDYYVKIVCVADASAGERPDGKYVIITGKVVDEKNKPVSTSIRWSYVYGDVVNEIIVETLENGTFRFYVPPTEKVRYLIEDKQYAVREEMILIPENTDAYDITIRLVSVANELKISGKVTDQQNNPLAANIYWSYKMDGELIEYRVLSNPDGSYEVSMPIMPMLSYRVEKTNFMPISGSTDIPIDKRSITMDFTMTKLAEREVFNIKNIQFEFGKATLLPSSYEVLDPLVKLMNDNPSLTIELAGHTDIVGGREFNLRLSNQRAQAVADYLINKGVNKDRIQVAGYGFDKPIADNKTDEGRALNRRVEMVIIGIDYQDDAYDTIKDGFGAPESSTRMVGPVQATRPVGTGELPAATEDNFRSMVQSAMGNQRGNLKITLFFENGKIQSAKVDIISGSIPESTIDQISDLLLGWKISSNKRFMHTLNVQK